jgi:hypothetical protein
LSEDPDNSQSNILVEFFEDQYEEEQAAVKSLMGVFKKIAETLSRDGQRNAYPTSTFVCFSGRSFAPSNFHNPVPEDQIRFWKEMRRWTEEHPTEKYLEFFRPTLLQATASNHISDRVRALLRDQPFLDGAMVILSKKLHLMLEDFTLDYSYDNPMRIQKATGIWAALMHHFVRALMMDLYSLPAEIMRQWTEIVVASQINRNLINMGQWALSCRLQEKDVTGSLGNAAGESNMAASAPADAGWDGLSGPFPARQEHPEAPPKRAVMDEMELAQDQCRWIPSEVLHDTTCQQKELRLSFRCCERKTCPRCARLKEDTKIPWSTCPLPSSSWRI